MDIGSLTGQIELDDQFSKGLDVVQHKIENFAKKYEETFAGIVVKGALGATAAIGGITASIIALGNRGSDVNDVAATFENFSGSVSNANDTLEKMQKGTLNTVDDMDLMKDASKLLAAGVKLSSDQFGTLSKAAFVLQNQGLGPTKEMLDLVSQALLTGRTRTLEMKIGKIDLTKAERDYAASLGVEKLTQMQKVEAGRIAILEALNKKVKEAGEQHRDFGESMEAAVVAFKNWGDSLASAVAKSPSVLNAVDRIGEAITKNFGGAGQTALEVIVGWINKFADAVANYAPPIIAAMAEVIDKVKEIYAEITHAWDTAPEWFRNIAKEALIAGVAVKAVSVASHEVTGQDVLSNVAALANIWSGFGGALKGVLPWISRVGAALQLYYLLGSGAGGGVAGGVAQVLTGIGGAIATLLVPAAITVSLAALAASIWQVVNAITAAKEAMAGGTSFGTFIMRQDKDNFVRRTLGLDTQNMPKAPGAPSQFQLPGAAAHVNITTGALTGASPASRVLSEADSAALEEYNKKLDAMKQKFKDASLESRLFSDTFKSLTEAQKRNYDVQQLLVPELEKMVEAHKTLTPEMQKVLSTSTALEQAYLDQERTTLAFSDITQESVDRAKEQGITEAQLAASYGVSTKALDLYLAEKKKELTISESIAAGEQKHRDDEAAAQKRKEDLALEGNKTLAESSKELQDLIDQQTHDSYEYQALQVKKSEAEKIAAFKGTKEQLDQYTKEQEEIAHERYAMIAKAQAEAAAEGEADTQESLSNQVHAWAGALTQIAQISGDAFGGIVKDIANVVASLDMAIQAQEQFNQATTKTAKAMALLQGVTAVAQATGQGSVGSRVLGGATSGAAIGSVFGPWGTAIGAAGGALVGLVRGIAGLTDYQKRMRAAVEETKNLQKSLIDTHGGMSQLITDASRVGINIQEALKWKDDPAALKHVIDDLDARLAKLDAGISKFTGGAAKRLDAFFHSFDAVRDLKDKNKDFLASIDEMLAGEAPEEVMGMVEQQARAVLKGINSAFIGQLGGTVDEVQKEFSRMGLYAGTAFAENLREHGWKAAVDAAGPMFDQLQSLHTEFGFQIDATTQHFVDFYNTVKSNSDVLDAMSGLTDMITGAGDALFLTQDLFNAFEADAITGYTRLTERGIDSNQALALMQPTLQALWEAQKKFGLVTDDATQSLIDQAVQQGIVGENMRDVNQQILDVLKGIAKALGADIPNAAAQAGKSIDDAFKDKTYHVKVEYDSEDPTAPVVEPQYHAAGGRVLPWTPRGTDTVPAMLTPGETVVPAGRKDEYVAEVRVPLNMDGTKIAEALVKVARRVG